MSRNVLVEDLIAIWRLLSQMSAPTQQGEITGQQFWLLRHLRRQGPMRIGALAVALGVSQSSATAACKRLEASGLVQRQRETDDERMVQVMLTGDGVERVETWLQQRHERVARLLAPLTAEDCDTLQRLLEDVLEEAERIQVSEIAGTPPQHSTTDQTGPTA